MALWQFNIQFIPRPWFESAGRRVDALFPGEGCYLGLPAWREHQPRMHLASLFSRALPPARSWNADILLWGNGSRTDAQVSLHRGLVEAIAVRVDVREDYARLLEQIVAIAGELGCVLLFPETRQVIEPDVFRLNRAIRESRATRFVKDPHAVLAEANSEAGTPHPPPGPRAGASAARVGTQLHPCLAAAEILAFEQKHAIRLPEEYRAFLQEVGNGGSELFPLGEMDEGFDVRPWQEGDAFIGRLAAPFPYTAAWNDLTGYPEYDKAKEHDEQWLAGYERKLDAFELRYWVPLNGAIPIAELGCAIRLWLVVAGPERGNVWHDDRANRNGLRPLLTPQGARVSFRQWCEGCECDWRNA